MNFQSLFRFVGPVVGINDPILAECCNEIIIICFMYFLGGRQLDEQLERYVRSASIDLGWSSRVSVVRMMRL